MPDPRSILAWALRHLSASPTALCLGVGCLTLVPLLAAARDVGLAPQDTDLADLATASTRLGATLGAALGLVAAQGGGFLLARASRGTRVGVEFLLIAVPATTLGLAVCTGAFATSPRVGLAAVLTLPSVGFHLGAVGTLVAKLPGSTVGRGAALLFAVLVLPGLLQSGAPLANVLQGLLDPFVQLPHDASLRPWLAGSSLLLAAALLPAPRSTKA